MKTIQKFSFLVFLMALATACSRPERKFILEFDRFLDSPVFDDSYLSHIYEKRDSARFDWDKYNLGDTIFWESRSKIIETNFPDVCLEETYDYLGIQAYKSNDTVFLFLEKPMGVINIYVHRTQYTASEFIFSHSSHRFGKGKLAKSTIVIPVKKSRLLLKTKSLNVGDRIYGFLYIETEEFYDNGVANTNFYRGAFTTVIISKEEFNKYRVPRIYM